MHYRDALKTAQQIMDERQARYASPEENFERIAALAELILQKPVSRYDVAMILFCVKLARQAAAPKHEDNIIDGINYLAFAGTFAQELEEET